MEKEISRQTYGSGLVLASALLFGTYGIWSRLIGGAMGNFYQGYTRALIILLLIVPLAFVRKEIVLPRKKDAFWLGIFLFCTSLTQAPIFYAFNHMDVGTASLLFFVSMFLTMSIVGMWFHGERCTRMKLISMSLALIGMCFVFSVSFKFFAPLAALMAIVNGIASGGEVAFSKKLSEAYSPLYLTLLSWLIILIANSIISLVIGESQLLPSLSLPWLWQVCYSLVSLFAFWFVIIGFKYVDAGIGALVGLLEIVFSIVFGVLLFHETLRLSMIFGAALIITAAAMPHLVSLYRQEHA